MKVPIDEIMVGGRFRKEMGDLTELACSIGAHGQLQPIGVTKDRKLVFGERRLRACRDVLGWDEIEAREVDVASLIEAERDENEIRKDFTPSERVAIAKAIEAEIGDRQGQRTDQHRDKCPEVDPGERTRDFAAKRSGFSTGKQYERAKKTVEAGTEEVVDAMDRGDVSISRAAEISKLPPKEQRQVIPLPKFEQSRILKKVREGEKIIANSKDEHPAMQAETIHLACDQVLSTSISGEDFVTSAAPGTRQKVVKAAPRMIDLMTEILKHDEKRKSTAA